MRKTALITGASSGIGLELARVFAEKGNNLVLVARNKKKLDELRVDLQNEYRVLIHVIEKDLSVENAPREVYEEIKKQDIVIDYLVNNAGFGNSGFFHETEWDNDFQMINLNVISLTQFCKLFLKDMVERKNGKIMNVASTAAFQPGPLMAVYYATKAFVLHFSEAIHNELSGKGVTVTALCPGATQSDFLSIARIEDTNLVKGKILPTSREVAVFGYKKMMKGSPVAIHGFLNYLLANSVRFTPRSLVRKIVRKIQDKSK
ncbi:MAG: SDR family NAD(P)-dependent oxidoreductase [Bacteroidota bacterium]